MIGMISFEAGAISTSNKKLPTFSSSKTLYTYKATASGSVTLYSDKALKKQATTISYTKPVKIVQVVSSTVIKVSYGGKTYYADRSKFTAFDFASQKTATAWTATKSVTTYKWKGNTTKLGSIDKGDTVYIIRGNSTSTWVQVIYPDSASKGYFMGWCRAADIYGKKISDCTISVSPTSMTYTGGRLKPPVTVKDGTLTLKEGTDYTVTYSNNTNVGTGKITITGKGSYYGSVTRTFTITKASNTVTASNITLTKSSSQQTGKLNAKPKFGGKLTYSSNNNNVKVDSNGNYTIAKNWTGTATITIKSASSSNYNSATKKITITVAASSWQMPMTNAYHTWGNGNSWGKNCNDYGRDNGNGRNYHIGVDLNSKSNSNVYAAADGTVVEADWDDGNGWYVTIEHTIGGKTVYSFYAHLKSKPVVTANQKVSAGTKIGVVGHSGSYAANSTNHVHFAIVDSLSKGGHYYGYATRFSGNKTTYSGRTFYNPIYVINNGKLP